MPRAWINPDSLSVGDWQAGNQTGSHSCASRCICPKLRALRKFGRRVPPTSASQNCAESMDAVQVVCCAERLDRIGRDMPDAEHVHMVEDEVRTFFNRAGNLTSGCKIAHLAMMLLCDEEQGRAVGLTGMQARIRLAFQEEGKSNHNKGSAAARGEMNWTGLKMMSMGTVGEQDPTPLIADCLWKDMAQNWGF